MNNNEELVNTMSELVNALLDTRLKALVEQFEDDKDVSVSILGRHDDLGLIRVDGKDTAQVGIGIIDLRDTETVAITHAQAATLVKTIFEVFPDLDLAGDQAKGEVHDN